MWLKTKRSTCIWFCLCCYRGEKVNECVGVFSPSRSQSLFKCLSVTRRELWYKHPPSPPGFHLRPRNIPLFWLFMVFCSESSELQLSFFFFFLSPPFLSPVLIDAGLIKCFGARVGALPVLKASDLLMFTPTQKLTVQLRWERLARTIRTLSTHTVRSWRKRAGVRTAAQVWTSPRKRNVKNS